MKYPLQIELEKDFNECVKLLSATQNGDNPLANEIAQKYFNAINRINDLCVNRKRY